MLFTLLYNTSVVESVNKSLEVKIWYRVEIDYNFEKLEVRIQNNNIREKKVFCKRNVKGLSRGTVAFSTNCNICINTI